MPGVHPFRGIWRKFGRKKKDEAAKVDSASTTTTISRVEQNGISTVLGEGMRAPVTKEEQIETIRASAVGQEVVIESTAKNISPGVSTEKFGMFYFTSKIPTPEQSIDLVAIHGLGGQYDRTWTDKNTDQNWLRDFLPSQVLGSTSVANVTNFAQELLADLKTCRATKALEKRPLIFVCHSLGGLVFKRMLALAHERTKLYQATLQSIRGVLFLGPPHAGSDIASMLNWLAKIANVASLGRTNNQLVEALKSQGRDLFEISESFVERGEQLDKIYSFFEQDKLYGSIVVTKGSARIGLSNEELVPMDCTHSTICKFSSPDNRQYERVLSKLQELVDAITNRNEFVSDTILRKEVLESLEKYGYNPRRYSISTEYQSTFRWIWKPSNCAGPGFVDWLESGSGLFWIAGKPGAGKSTLMKYISDSEQTFVLLQKQGDNVKKLDFCFFELGESHEKTFVGFLHSFLYQLVLNFPALVHIILPIYREIQARNTENDPHKLDWNQDDTRRALQAISKQNSVHGQVCVFIDGLDECDGGSMKTEDIDFIVNLQNWKPISIRICISARPELPIQLRLDKYSKLLVQDWTSGDIAKYVSKELQNSFELVYPQATPTSYSDILTYLTDTVVEKAEGVFLWVNLVIKELKTGVEGYDRDDDLKLRLNSLPKGIDDLYGAIFAKILPEDLHHAINYLEVVSKKLGLMTLHDMSFIDEGPQLALDRPFAAIPIVERIERCRKIKGRVVRCTRNLLDFREDSAVKDGYLAKEYENVDAIADDVDNGGPKDEKHEIRSVSGVSTDESTDLVSHDGELTKSPGGPSVSPLVQEGLLLLEVSFVHRTLQEYMNKDTVWEPIVLRASKNKLTEPYLSMLACTLSKFKTSPPNWRERQDLEIGAVISQLNRYIRGLENSNITYCGFLESMFTGLKKQFPNWTEFWGLPKDWGCDILCILARGTFKLHFKETFEQKRVENYHLPHLLVHHYLSFNLIADSEIVQVILQNGGRVEDSFLDHSAWEFLLWEICWLQGDLGAGTSEICRISLENGANPNIVIQPPTLEKFPLDRRTEIESQARNFKLPCCPLHMIITSLDNLRHLLTTLPIINMLLEYGARLDIENADGQTVLELAARWKLSPLDGKWNLAPILLRLQKECEIAPRGKFDSTLDPLSRGTILDLLNLPLPKDMEDLSSRGVSWKLKRALKILEEDGYGYVSIKGNASPDSRRSSLSISSGNLSQMKALEGESIWNSGPSSSDSEVVPSTS